VYISKYNTPEQTIHNENMTNEKLLAYRVKSAAGCRNNIHLFPEKNSLRHLLVMFIKKGVEANSVSASRTMRVFRLIAIMKWDIMALSNNSNSCPKFSSSALFV
jgi:hypothetical protein